MLIYIVRHGETRSNVEGYLQGWTDDYFEKAEFVNSNSQLYKQAGNGVTVNVIKAIAEKF